MFLINVNLCLIDFQQKCLTNRNWCDKLILFIYLFIYLSIYLFIYLSILSAIRRENEEFVISFVNIIIGFYYKLW